MSLISIRDRLIQWLKTQTANDRESMSHFTRGGFVFSAGMMTIILAHQLMRPSLHQEVVALIGLITVIIGAGLALWGYVRMSLFKILLILLERHND